MEKQIEVYRISEGLFFIALELFNNKFMLQKDRIIEYKY